MEKGTQKTAPTYQEEEIKRKPYSCLTVVTLHHLATQTRSLNLAFKNIYLLNLFLQRKKNSCRVKIHCK